MQYVICLMQLMQYVTCMVDVIAVCYLHGGC